MILWLLIFTALPRWVEPIEVSGCVVHIVDGDTIDVEPDPQHHDLPALIRIRLADIDAPERGATGSREATDWLRDRVDGREVRLTLLGWDRFRRLVARVQTNGEDVGVDMIRQGLADRWPRRR